MLNIEEYYHSHPSYKLKFLLVKQKNLGTVLPDGDFNVSLDGMGIELAA